MAGTSPGSRKWRTSDWQCLLRDAISLLDTLDGAPPWAFGGGTALAVHYRHRTSYDVDIFVADSDVVTALSPARNPATKALLAGRSYEFPGIYLKLQLNAGEIDFIVGGKRTSEPVEPWDFEGRTIMIETPWETVIRKIFHRPSTFKVRDVFDLAAVIDRHGEKLTSFLPEVEDRLDKLIDRIDALAPSYEAMAVDDINPTGLGERYMRAAAIRSAQAFLTDWKHRSRPAD